LLQTAKTIKRALQTRSTQVTHQAKRIRCS